MSFPRYHRLVAKAEFDSLFNNASKVSQKHLVVLFKPNKTRYARLGIIVGKRVAKKAVTRNQFKRVMRESFRHYQQKLSGVDIVVIARQSFDKLGKQKLREGIDQLWQKLLTH